MPIHSPLPSLPSSFPLSFCLCLDVSLACARLYDVRRLIPGSLLLPSLLDPADLCCACTALHCPARPTLGLPQQHAPSNETSPAQPGPQTGASPVRLLLGHTMLRSTIS